MDESKVWKIAKKLWSTLKNLNNSLQPFERAVAQFTIGGFEILNNNDREALDNIEQYYGEMFKDRIEEEEEYAGDVKLLDKVFKIPLNRKFKNPTIEFKIEDSLDTNKN